MTNMEDTVESKTLNQLMTHPVWPAAVTVAAVPLIPKEPHQTPTTLDFRPITVTCLLGNLWAGHASMMPSGGAKRGWLPKSVAGAVPENRTCAVCAVCACACACVLLCVCLCLCVLCASKHLNPKPQTPNPKP